VGDELLSAFNERRVKYLIVGGYAVAILAQPRATKELDIFIESTAENARAVFAALGKFGTAPSYGFRTCTLLPVVCYRR